MERDVPYASIEDLPPTLQWRLPPHAQEIFAAAFNSAWNSYGRKHPEMREEIAHRVAWAAVKRRYRKAAGAWVPIGA